MSAFILVILGLALLGLLGLLVMAGVEAVAAARRRRARHVALMAAEIRLQRLTFDAMCQMLNEARRHQSST